MRWPAWVLQADAGHCRPPWPYLCSYAMRLTKPTTLNPLVSIITPCFNCGEFIEEAIQSVLNQTYDNFELIIVNDGSTDNSEATISQFEDRRIRYLRQSNKGQGAASNLGITKAKGDYIKFFDADDLMNQRHIEKMVACLAGNGANNAVAFCQWTPLKNGEQSNAKCAAVSNQKDILPIEWLKTELKQYCDMVPGWRWLIPNSLLKKAGAWDERLTLNNDFEFSLRLLRQSAKMIFAKDAKIYYRWASAGGLSQRQSEQSFSDAILATDLGCSYLLDMERSDEIVNICIDRYKMWLTRIPDEYDGLKRIVESKITEMRDLGPTVPRLRKNTSKRPPR